MFVDAMKWKLKFDDAEDKIDNWRHSHVNVCLPKAY
jgi:hypothetical protein